MFRNTRLSARTLLPEFAFIQILGDDGGRILNISDSGLCFESFAPLGSMKTLRFWFSLNLRERVEAMGEVVWLDSGTKVGGLRFVNPTDRVMEHIRRYRADLRQISVKGRGQRFAEALAKQKPEAVPAKSAAMGSSELPGQLSPQANGKPPFSLTRDASTEFSGSTGLESTDLISLRRHVEVSRKRFLQGVLLGLFVAVTTTVALYRFWGPKPPPSVPRVESSSSSSTEPVPGVAASLSVDHSKTAGGAESQSRPTATDAAALRQTSSRDSTPKSDRSLATVSASKSDLAGAANRNVGLSQAAVKRSTKQSATPQQLWSAVQVGDADAAVALADRYLRGDGVPKNCLQARVLLLVASEKKNGAAIKKLEELDKTGCPASPIQ